MTKPLYPQNDQTRGRGLQRGLEAVKRRTRGYTTVLDNGVALPQQDTIDFVGATITDDTTEGKTVVTMAGGGAAPGAFIPYQDGSLPAGDTNLPIVFIAESVPGVFTQTGAGANPFTINELGTYLFQFSVSVTNPNATDAVIQFIFDTSGAPGFWTSVPIVLSFVAPAAGKPVTPLYNGSIAGTVFDVSSDECNLITHCSQPLDVFSPYLVVSRLSTGLI